MTAGMILVTFPVPHDLERPSHRRFVLSKQPLGQSSLANHKAPFFRCGGQFQIDHRSHALETGKASLISALKNCPIDSAVMRR